jgi:non-lysosomal glucosylceramidase
MKGASCYCGGLWLGAVNASVKMAERIGDKAFATEWRPIAAAAGKAFEEKLWNGTNYRLDTDGESPDALFVDGLFGIWFAGICGLKNLIPPDHYRTHLNKTYQRNFVESGRGFGAVNISGWNQAALKQVEDSNFATEECQLSEILFGLNLSFAGQLLDAGLKQEANELLNCLYAAVYGKFGLWFRSPAAWTKDARFRAIINLRPLIIWALIANSPDSRQS